MSEIREKLCKELLITLDIACLSEHIISRIDELVKAHPGTCSLLMKVVDNDERVEVGLLSRSLRVAPANTLLNALHSLDGVRCKVA